MRQIRAHLNFQPLPYKTQIRLQLVPEFYGLILEGGTPDRGIFTLTLMAEEIEELEKAIKQLKVAKRRMKSVS